MKYTNEHVGRYSVQIIGVDGEIRVDKVIYNTITDGFLRLLSEALYGDVDVPGLIAIAVGDTEDGTAEDGTSTILKSEIKRKGIGPNRLLDATLPLITTFVNFAYEDFDDPIGGIVEIKELGVFAKDETSAEIIATTKDTGRMVSRIVLPSTETLIAGEVIRINRSDEFRRFGV